jgi:hypothetical protein
MSVARQVIGWRCGEHHRGKVQARSSLAGVELARLSLRWTRTRLTGAGSRAVAAVVVGLMVFSSSAGPEPEQSGSGETASASNGTVYPESSPHPFAGDSTWIAYQTDRGGEEGVWLVHPDGTEDHQIAMDVAPQSLLPDWSPDGGRLVFTTRGGSTEPLYEYDLAKDESRQRIRSTQRISVRDEAITRAARDGSCDHSPERRRDQRGADSSGPTDLDL